MILHALPADVPLTVLCLGQMPLWPCPRYATAGTDGNVSSPTSDYKLGWGNLTLIWQVSHHSLALSIVLKLRLCAFRANLQTTSFLTLANIKGCVLI